MWGTFLSEPLSIADSVSRYLTDYLMERIPIRDRPKSLIRVKCSLLMSSGINPSFEGLSQCQGQVGYVLLTRLPVVDYEKQAFHIVTPRLACVKPVASVHPEPGSNSSL